MRIFLLNQVFHPDSAATSQFLTDLACRLAADGHSVHALRIDESAPTQVLYQQLRHS